MTTWHDRAVGVGAGVHERRDHDRARGPHPRPATVCFVGIGLPSTAANLARRLHAPDCVLVYESGCIGAKPSVLPLSIGDGVLAEHADAVVSVTEMFGYWLQAGRIDVGFLERGTDRSARQPQHHRDRRLPVTRVRLPGAGGAPEIAASCGEVIITIRQNRRTFVDRLDFVTSVGHGDGGDHRQRLGLRGKGPTAVITDLGILRPDQQTKELTLMSVHPGIDVDEARAATGWPLRVADVVTSPSRPPAPSSTRSDRCNRHDHLRVRPRRAPRARGVRRRESPAGGRGSRSCRAARILVIASTAEDLLADELSHVLGDRVVGRFSDVVQHVPIAKAQDARAMVRDTGADAVLTVGGGSATGLGKAIALEVDVVQIAVPTTYAGSEMTPIWGSPTATTR